MDTDAKKSFGQCYTERLTKNASARGALKATLRTISRVTPPLPPRDDFEIPAPPSSSFLARSETNEPEYFPAPRSSSFPSRCDIGEGLADATTGAAALGGLAVAAAAGAAVIGGIYGAFSYGYGFFVDSNNSNPELDDAKKKIAELEAKLSEQTPRENSPQI